MCLLPCCCRCCCCFFLLTRYPRRGNKILLLLVWNKQRLCVFYGLFGNLIQEIKETTKKIYGCALWQLHAYQDMENRIMYVAEFASVTYRFWAGDFQEVHIFSLATWCFLKKKIGNVVFFFEMCHGQHEKHINKHPGLGKQGLSGQLLPHEFFQEKQT